MKVLDPRKFVKLCWPDITLYDKQWEILYSVRDNDETFVPAGNQLGKDFVSALCALWFFVSRRPAKVVTTSVKSDQLDDVLWAEIRRFVDTSAVKLPIRFNHLQIRQEKGDSRLEPRSSLTGQVTRQGESLLGRHIERAKDGTPTTLAIFDEASGLDDQAYESSDTWAHRKLIIGNPYPCNNFFFRGVKGGDLSAPNGRRLYRKVIRIKADDSPNVKAGKMIIPGVIDKETYEKRRQLWDSVRQCIGLDAEFYEGSEVLLFPPQWLNEAEKRAEELDGKHREAKTIGIDPAQGGDSTCWAIVDELGLIDLISKKTPDTSVITGETLAMMRRHGVKPDSVLFDAGGGGKEHADRLRTQGYNVRTVAFGESVTKRVPMRSESRRRDAAEDRYAYRNRRAEMYGTLRQLLDPSTGDTWAIPGRFSELRRQLGLFPLQYDGEGRMELPPKQKRDPKSTKPTLTDIIGHSPDEADAVVLAVYGMMNPRETINVGRAF